MAKRTGNRSAKPKPGYSKPRLTGPGRPKGSRDAIPSEFVDAKNPSELLRGTREIAREFGISSRTFRAWLKKAKLDLPRIGRLVVLPRVHRKIMLQRFWWGTWRWDGRSVVKCFRLILGVKLNRVSARMVCGRRVFKIPRAGSKGSAEPPPTA